MTNGYTIGIYEKAMPLKMSWPEKFLWANAMGYDFIEMSIDETEEKVKRLDMGKAELRELAAMGKIMKAPIGSICLSALRKYPLGSASKSLRLESLSILKKAIELAAEMGIPIIQIPGYDVYYEKASKETLQNFTDALETLVPFAACKGIILGFETMENDFMNTVEKALQYVKAVNSPFLQVYPDLGNITNAADGDSLRVCEDITPGAGHIVAVHLKDSLPGIYRNLELGTGHVDFDQAIKTAWKLGVRRYVAEVWCQDERWRDVMERGIRMIREIVNKQMETDSNLCSQKESMPF